MPEIKLYNTRTRSKEVFTPIDPKNVRMYACGPTVYDRAHIGNARPVVVFDVLYRLLRHVYGAEHVTYVRNFTDVDDKIIDKAVAVQRPGETLEEATRRVTDETIGWYHEDMDALGALRPDHEPRCTEYIPPMVAMSQALIDKGFAYAAEGHVLFSVEAYENYGRLSGRSVDDMIAGARVEVAPYKKNPMDFVIWKPSTDEQPGWDSPWGRGRPGWHIECSAMAKDLLGEVFDIHAGGIDLQFPHHENELAQSCCVHGTDRMANWWLHNEMLRVEGEKMSKSLGNFFTVRDLLDEGLAGDVIKLVLLSAQYRQPLDWNEQIVEQTKKAILTWHRAIDAHRDEVSSSSDQAVDAEFLAALADDLNMPLAFARLHALAKSARSGDAHASRALANSVDFIGLNHKRWFDPQYQTSLRAILLGNDDPKSEDLIAQLLEERTTARKSRDFARADEIRDGFAAAGVIVKDTAQGAIWELSPDFDPTKLEALK
ncbi:MAG: cysteine--tRNA ligase [Pseudomonadota bacterium]